MDRFIPLLIVTKKRSKTHIMGIDLQVFWGAENENDTKKDKNGMNRFIPLLLIVNNEERNEQNCHQCYGNIAHGVYYQGVAYIFR